MDAFWNDKDLESLFTSEILPPDLVERIKTSDEARQELAGIMRMVGSAARLAAASLETEATADVVGRIGPQAPRLLAAKTGDRLEPVEIGAEAGVHAVFVDTETGKGVVRALRVKLVEARYFEIKQHPSVRCDLGMTAAAERGVNGAVKALKALGYGLPATGLAIEWRIGNDDEAQTYYTGASLGLAVAVASAALLTGARIEFDVVASGAVDDLQVLPVQGIAEKFEAIAQTQAFSQFLIPTASVGALPPGARQSHQPQVLWVGNLSQAINILIGDELGLGAPRLAAETGPAPAPANIYLHLWEDMGVTRSVTRSTRSIGTGGYIPAEVRRIGDWVRFGVYASADCYLTLLNHGSSGNIQCLAPGLEEGLNDTRLTAGEKRFFPKFQFLGPDGTENLIALATRRPPHEDLRDFLNAVDRGTATFADVRAVMNSPQVLGKATCKVEVLPAIEPAGTRFRGGSTRGVAAPQVRWLSFELG